MPSRATDTPGSHPSTHTTPTSSTQMMLTGRKPFIAANLQDVYVAINSCQYVDPGYVFRRVPVLSWRVCACGRARRHSVCRHPPPRPVTPFFHDRFPPLVSSLMSRLLTHVPKRINIDQLCAHEWFERRVASPLSGASSQPSVSCVTGLPTWKWKSGVVRTRRGCWRRPKRGSRTPSKRLPIRPDRQSSFNCGLRGQACDCTPVGLFPW